MESSAKNWSQAENTRHLPLVVDSLHVSVLEPCEPNCHPTLACSAKYRNVFSFVLAQKKARKDGGEKEPWSVSAFAGRQSTGEGRGGPTRCSPRRTGQAEVGKKLNAAAGDPGKLSA
jgi:hypothetical protein